MYLIYDVVIKKDTLTVYLQTEATTYLQISVKGQVQHGDVGSNLANACT